MSESSPSHKMPSVDPPDRASSMPSSDAIEPPSNETPSAPAPAKAPPKKKKGTASTIKPPKRPKPPSSSTTTTASKKPKSTSTNTTGTTPGSSASKKPKSASSKSLPNDPSPGGGPSGPAGDDDPESDSGPYCLCRGPDNHRFMIACDRCEDWFHGECIGMDKYTGENLVLKYICPNCADGTPRYVTRYKRVCSFTPCNRPARLYDPLRPSVFCSDDHCQAWWEALVEMLPRGASTGGRSGSGGDGSGSEHHADRELTQQDLVGLLESRAGSPSSEEDKRQWRLGDTPFGIPPTFWDSPTSHRSLTPEETAALQSSAAHRYALGEEIVLCKKMLHLLDLALARRDAAIASPTCPLATKDMCGYDFRLDAVAATAPFKAFLATPEGEAIFKTGGKLEAPLPVDGDDDSGNGVVEDPLTAGMCTKKKCRTHMGWSAVLAKNVKHAMRELARQAKERLDAEARVRDSAASRFQRKAKEKNYVVVLDGSDDKIEI